MSEYYGKKDISDAERQRRREQALELHKQVDPLTGRRKFGGPQPGSGRPKKKRITESLNEKIEGKSNEIFNTLERGMNSDDERVALQAVKQMIEIATKEIEYQEREKRDFAEMSKDELIKLVMTNVSALANHGDIPILDFIDVEAIEVESNELEEGSF